MSEKYKSPEDIVNQTIYWVEKHLEEGEIESTQERDFFLQKLYTALAVNNDQKVSELIKYIEGRYGKTGEV